MFSVCLFIGKGRWEGYPLTSGPRSFLGVGVEGSLWSQSVFYHTGNRLFAFIPLVIGTSQEDPNAVVVGLCPECLNYADMNNAFR